MSFSHMVLGFFSFRESVKEIPMARYDGSIRINTDVATRNAQVQLAALENRIVKTVDKISGLRSKMDALKDAKVPTQEYIDLQKEISAAKKELEKMVAQDSKLADIDSKIKELSKSSAEYAEKMKEVGKSIPSMEYEALQDSIKKSKDELAEFKKIQDRLAKTGIGKDVEKDVSYLAASENIKKLQYELQKAIATGNKEAYLGIEDRLNRAKSILEELMSKEARPLGDIKYYYVLDKKISDLKKNISETESELKKLEESGEAFSVDTKSPEYQNLAKKYEAVNKELEKQKGLQSEIAQKQADTVQKTVELKGQMQQLVAEGKDFTMGQDTEEYAKLGQQIQYAENDLTVLTQKHDILNDKLQRTDGYKKLANAAKSAFDSIGRILKKANSAVNAFGKRIKEIAQKHLPFFRKETERTKSSLSGFGARLRSLALSLLIFNQISKAFSVATSGIKEGFSNLYEENERFRNSIDSLKASLLTLKNALAGAFAPIVEIAIPYIQKLIGYLTDAVNLIGQFIAALTGRKTYTRAVKQSAAASEKAAEASKEEAEAVEDTTDAMDKQLSPLDKLNNMRSEKPDAGKKDKDPDKGTAGGGAGNGIMFEEVPIDSNIIDMADKVKDILSKLFAPLKEAWDREGKFVMDSWKYALDEVWKLIKDIGRDFLTVWQQEKTIKIFEDILHIIGDIGLIVGHLARNFRDAWNENKTGLHILENIRDIIGAIIHNIRLAADKTVEWADKLNFKPLLEAFERFTESLIPVMDNLSGILTDFYTQVLLPLAKWTIEKGLPELLDVFTAFNDKVDWEALRANLSEFWDHLEPFAEKVGEGLILFIEDVSDALADFLNSQEFKDFLVMIEEWMDNVSPEDVANALKIIAEALIGLKLVLLGFSAISALSGVFSTIKDFFLFLWKAGGLVAKGVSMIVTNIGYIMPALALVSAAVVGWDIGTWINEKLLGVDTPAFTEMMEGIKSSFQDGSWKEALHLWGEDIKAAWKEIWGYVKEDWENSYIGEMIGSFTDGTWQEALNLWGDDIYNAFVTLGERQQEVWDSILSTIKQKFEEVKDAAKDAFEWIADKVEAIAEKIASIGEKAKNIGSSFASSPLFSGRSPLLYGRSYSTAAPYSVHPAVAALQNAEFPAYATGQVIPRTMKEHLALLGDNNKETEYVAPESAMKKSFIDALAESGITSRDNTGGGNTYEFSVDGQVFFRIMEKYAAEYKKQHGGKPAFG